jgi:HPt (histidine-containing phosphotransfer) domain-containing protein
MKEDSHMLSEFAEDMDMQPLISEFLTELDERLAGMETLVRQGDFAELGRLAHQLKGAGGGYGYPAITQAAACLESAARGEAPGEQVGPAFTALAALCRRAIAAGTAPLTAMGMQA